jgi:hypothetical protein
MVYAAAILVGGVLIVQDIMYGRVHVILLICLVALCCAACYIENKRPCFIPLYIMSFISCVYYALRKIGCFGLADYFALFATSFLYEPANWPYFVMICGGLGIMTSLSFRNRKFPFIPAILVSGFITKFIDSPFW